MIVFFGDGFISVCLMLVLRTLPFAVYAVHCWRTRRTRRALPLVLFALSALLLWAVGRGEAVLWTVLGLGYYAAGACTMPSLSRCVRDGAITRGALFAVLVVALLLVPGILLPGVAIVLFLSVGWELVLSSYSYCVETAHMPRREDSLPDCLFFLLIDPTLLYTQRGRWSGEVQRTGLGLKRLGSGIGVFALNAFLLGPMLRWIDLRGLPWTPAAFVLLLLGALRFLSEYAAHSGVASLHIGLMRAFGWEIPERYDHPLLSTSPMDFWRRWNIYVRVWLEAYVFLPLSFVAARRTRSRLAQAGVALLTLLTCGLLHDLHIFAGRQDLSLRVTALFLAGGVLLLLWRVSALLVHLLVSRRPGARGLLLESPASPRLCMALVLLGLSAVWSQR